jgi:hypothetical protein
MARMGAPSHTVPVRRDRLTSVGLLSLGFAPAALAAKRSANHTPCTPRCKDLFHRYAHSSLTAWLTAGKTTFGATLQALIGRPEN